LINQYHQTKNWAFRCKQIKHCGIEQLEIGDIALFGNFAGERCQILDTARIKDFTVSGSSAKQGVEKKTGIAQYSSISKPQFNLTLKGSVPFVDVSLFLDPSIPSFAA